MRRMIGLVIFALALLGASPHADAAGMRGGGSMHGMHGGGLVGRGHGDRGFAGRGHFGGGFHDGRHFRGHHDRFRSSVVFGVGPLWWDPWWGYPRSYSTVVVQPPAATVYVDPQSAGSGYWYYCNDSEQYYPYVTECPEGWTTVAPPEAPPE